jgi:hypothetical protein
MSSPIPDEDVDRDAWLREALRHAPDAQLGPSADLSDAILRAAQAKARRAAPPARPRPSWGQRLWMWLAQPAVGAGLATVMIGSVVGTMWWDRPLPEPTAHKGVPEVSVAAPPPVAVATVPREAADTAATAAPPAPLAAEARKREAPAAAADDTLRRRRQAAVRTEPQADAAPGAAPGTMQAPAPAPAVAANDAVAQAARTAEAMAPAAPSVAVPETTAAHLAPSAPADRTARRPLAKSVPLAAVGGESAAIDRAFIAMRLAVSAEAQRWTWRRGDEAEQPIGDTLTAWLAELDAATASRWRPAPPPSPAAPPSLQLLREGRVMHTLQLGTDAVRWDAADPEGSGVAARTAALDAARAQALRQALARMVR